MGVQPGDTKPNKGIEQKLVSDTKDVIQRNKPETKAEDVKGFFNYKNQSFFPPHLILSLLCVIPHVPNTGCLPPSDHFYYS